MPEPIEQTKPRHLHQPNHWHGPVALSDGLCNACRSHGEPEATWTVQVTSHDGQKSRQEWHCHGVDSDPMCDLCGSNDELAAWPCLPLRRAASFLGVPIEDVSVGGEQR